VLFTEPGRGFLFRIKEASASGFEVEARPSTCRF